VTGVNSTHDKGDFAMSTEEDFDFFSRPARDPDWRLTSVLMHQLNGSEALRRTRRTLLRDRARRTDSTAEVDEIGKELKDVPLTVAAARQLHRALASRRSMGWAPTARVPAASSRSTIRAVPRTFTLYAAAGELDR